MSHHHHEEHKNLKAAFYMNLGFSIFEFFGGLYTGSYAILSDSLHDLGDSFIILIAIIMNKKAHSKQTFNKPFGSVKYQTFASLLTSTILLIGSMFIIYGAVNNIGTDYELKSNVMILIALIGVGVNLSALYKLKKNNSRLSRSVMLHMLEDALGWIAVLISSIVISITNLVVLDPILSILISLFIIYNAFKNIFSCFKNLMLYVEDNDTTTQIKQYLSTTLNIEEEHFKLLEIQDNHYYLLLNCNINVDDKELKKLGVDAIYYSHN